MLYRNTALPTMLASAPYLDGEGGCLYKQATAQTLQTSGPLYCLELSKSQYNDSVFRQIEEAIHGIITIFRCEPVTRSSESML